MENYNVIMFEKIYILKQFLKIGFYLHTINFMETCILNYYIYTAKVV